jgi:thioredoxin-like negative regulator of GroEL
LKATLRAVCDADFDRVVSSTVQPVLVEFWKPACGHCRALTAELERLQEELAGRLVIVAMNADENFQIPAELEIDTLPALALFRHGAFERFIGGLGTRDAILRELQLGSEGL